MTEAIWDSDSMKYYQIPTLCLSMNTRCLYICSMTLDDLSDYRPIWTKAWSLRKCFSSWRKLFVTIFNENEAFCSLFLRRYTPHISALRVKKLKFRGREVLLECTVRLFRAPHSRSTGASSGTLCFVHCLPRQSGVNMWLTQWFEDRDGSQNPMLNKTQG